MPWHLRRGQISGRGALDGGQPLTLDFIGTAPTAAYSTRKLRAAYAGSCLRVRRTSDNAEQDIGFLAGSLDTAALAAFCAATDGRVVTWYDQGTSGRNLTQATAGIQPKIVAAGTVITTINSKPSIQFVNSSGYILSGAALSNFITNSAYTIFCTARPTAGLGTNYNSPRMFGDPGGYLWCGAAASNLVAMGHFDTAAKQNTPPAIFPTSLIALTRFGSSTLSGWVSGGVAASVAANNVGSLAGTVHVGGAAPIEGTELEVLFFNSALSLADINILGEALASYSGVTWTTAT